MDKAPLTTRSDELHAEIEALHAESMARLNRLAWQVEDLLQLCEILQGEITALGEVKPETAKRAKMARTLLQGAANKTSQRMATRLVIDWFPAQVQQALQRMAQEATPCN